MVLLTNDKVFSTEPLPQRDRVAYWQDVVCRLYFPCESRETDARNFTGQVAARSVGALELAEISSSAISYDRTAADVRNSPDDDFLLSLVIDGTVNIAQDDRSTHIGPNQMALFDSARPYSIAFPEAFFGITLKIPRAGLLSRIPDAERATSIRMDGRTGPSRLANTMIRESWTASPDLDQPLNARMSTILLDVIALAMEAQNIVAPTNRSGHQSLLASIKKYAMAHLFEAELNAAAIAEAFNMSIRTLYRLFGEEGLTISRWLWQQRLHASYSRLAEGRVANVTAAAFDCGFNDCSHFTRAFKREFGVTPATVLRGPTDTQKVHC